MKRNTKTTSWIIAAIILLLACIIVVHYLVNSPFEETRIYPDDSREHPKDTIFTVNGIALKMIGVKGGRIILFTSWILSPELIFIFNPILSGYMLPVLVVWMRMPHIMMLVWVGIKKIQAIPLILLSKSSQIRLVYMT